MRVKKVVLILIGVMLTLFLVGCGESSNKSSQKSTEDTIKAVFREPNDKSKDSGVIETQKVDDKYIITYNFFPVGIKDYNSELGVQLAPKIKELYEKTNIDKIEFRCSAPFDDSYGNTSWKPIISFEMNKDIVKKINWDNFNPQKLISISENVQQLKK